MSDTFSAEERAAMKDRAAEVRRQKKGKQTPEELAADQAEAIAALDEPERSLATRIAEIVAETAPDLQPKLWYGMPGWAAGGKNVLFFQSAAKFKTRYSTLGFSEPAHLDDGDMWATSFAIMRLSPEVEVQVADLVRRAID